GLASDEGAEWLDEDGEPVGLPDGRGQLVGQLPDQHRRQDRRLPRRLDRTGLRLARRVQPLDVLRGRRSRAAVAPAARVGRRRRPTRERAYPFLFLLWPGGGWGGEKICDACHV